VAVSHLARFAVLTSILTGVSIAVYPVLVYLGLTYWNLRGFSLVIVAVFVLRIVAIRFNDGNARQVLRGALVVMSVVGFCLAAMSFFQGSDDAILLYPVTVNCLLFLVFFFSLLRPPSIIERIARIRDAELTDNAVAYTRKVTVVWTIFFAANGLMALYTAVAAPLEIWTLYNGAVAYILIGLIFSIEYCWRTFVVKTGHR